MLGRVISFALDGVDSRRVVVEADIRSSGLPSFAIVGLGDKAVREARDRVRSAIENSGYVFPACRITVNLAPAYLRKFGASFDLALAMAILASSEQVPTEAVAQCAFAGELSLRGEVWPIRGALAIAQGARSAGMHRLVVPDTRAREAAIVDGIEIVGVATLQQAVEVLSDEMPVPRLPPERQVGEHPSDIDLSDVRGHNGLIPGLEAAVAGGHNLFMQGPPGTGKTMIAQRIPALLPPLDPDEAIEVTKIYSVAGHDTGGRLVSERPFRAPHHTISPPGLVGGGATPLPGEITLAHRGVLFLDELSEFSRSALEALRQPLEDGRVVIVRGQRMLCYPTRCMLVAASNPCPCGRGDSAGCRCSGADLARHERRLSGPLMDRLDIMLRVERPTAAALRSQAAPASAQVRERVLAARAIQRRRFAGTAVRCNAHMSPAMVRHLVDATHSAMRSLWEMHDRNDLSARGHHRVLRVARTIADLEGSRRVETQHVESALALRVDSTPRALAA